MSPQHVLLTGATGFIGQRLQYALIESGRKISAIIRPGSAHFERLHPECHAIQCELNDKDRLSEACSGIDAVIYCAGTVRGRELDDFTPANVDGVAQLAAAMNQSACQAPFLLVSSLAASRPGISDYANSKFLGEQELISKAQFPWTIFRPPAVYGPGDKEMLPILRMASRGFVTPTGPAGQRLSLLHSDDLATATLAWLEGWQKCKGQIFTLDDGRQGGYDWQAIAEAASGGRYHSLGIPRFLLFAVARINLGLSGLLGYAPMLTPGKARELTQDDWLCDNSDLNQALGWKPTIGLETGIRQLFG